MPRRTTPLNDTGIKKVKPAEKPKKLFDGGGAFSAGLSDWRKVMAAQVSIWGEGKIALSWSIPPHNSSRSQAEA